VRTLRAIGLTVVSLAVTAGGAQAATPRQATKRIAACMKRAGAVRVAEHGRSGGKAYFARPFNATNVHYVQWGGYATSASGQVIGTTTSSVGLTRRQRRAANRCLRPFNGSV
jgi:hypothetical protein